MTRAGILQALDGTHPRIGRVVALILYGLIVLSAGVIAVETLPGLPGWLHRALVVAEIVVLSVFTLEYGLRLVCNERPLAYATSFWGIVDLLAIAPAILFLWPDAQTIRLLRLLRLVRILKLFYANRALDRLQYAFVKNRSELAVFSFIALVVLYLSAVGVYQFERHAQPEIFGSIPAALWWSIATLTTVGYGDVYPVTTAGRVFTGLVLLVGLGVIAVPAGLITSALLEDPPPREPDDDPADADPADGAASGETARRQDDPVRAGGTTGPDAAPQTTPDAAPDAAARHPHPPQPNQPEDTT